jgi:aryl-alcohol dehydrogenase-like predicted oxidoreductase
MGWNEGGENREEFLEYLSRVEEIRAALEPEEDLVETALRYVMSHPADPVVIPGATSPAQAIENASVGDRTLEADRRRELRDLGSW